MLKFFLDEHLSADICEIASKKTKKYVVESILTFKDGILRGSSDEELLEFCRKNKMILVTGDLATIPTLLKRWAEEERHHQGILFISSKTIRLSDSLRIAKGLVQIAEDYPKMNWTDQILFLK